MDFTAEAEVLDGLIVQARLIATSRRLKLGVREQAVSYERRFIEQRRGLPPRGAQKVFKLGAQTSVDPDAEVKVLREFRAQLRLHRRGEMAAAAQKYDAVFVQRLEHLNLALV